MNLFLLTASHDQHVGFRHAAGYIKRAVDRVPKSIMCGWIIADDGERAVFDDYETWKNVDEQVHPDMLSVVTIRRPPSPSGLQSFIGNMRELAVTLGQVAGPDDIAAVIEDDWFHADYLRDACAAFQENSHLLLWGETRTRYYRVDNRRYHIFNANGRAALSATVMRAQWGATQIRQWADRSRSTMMLDDVLWRRAIVPVWSPVSRDRQILMPESRYVVGIKGLPGTKGLGIGSDLDERHSLDEGCAVLRQWIGALDAERYYHFGQ